MASFGVQNHRHSNDGPTQVSATSTTTVPIDTCTSSKEPETYYKEGYHSIIERAYSTGNEHYKNMEYDDRICICVIALWEWYGLSSNMGGLLSQNHTCCRKALLAFSKS